MPHNFFNSSMSFEKVNEESRSCSATSRKENTNHSKNKSKEENEENEQIKGKNKKRFDIIKEVDEDKTLNATEKTNFNIKKISVFHSDDIFDLSCVFYKDYKTIKDKIVAFFDEKKFTYKFFKNREIFCTKKGIKFEIEFLQKSNDTYTIILPKKLEGKNNAFNLIIKSMLGRLS